MLTLAYIHLHLYDQRLKLEDGTNLFPVHDKALMHHKDKLYDLLKMGPYAQQ